MKVLIQKAYKYQIAKNNNMPPGDQNRSPDDCFFIRLIIGGSNEQYINFY